MVDIVLRLIVRLALRWFYRVIEVVDVHRVPARGAVLLAANHPNAMVDALVIIAAAPRVIRLTAKATLLDHLATRLVVKALRIVPLRRASDATTVDQGSVGRNADAFRAVVDALAAESAVLIFPEGRSHSEPSLVALKTGCARMALEARAAGVDPLVVLPVGLNFEQKERARSRVAVYFGEPIAVTEVAGPRPPLVEALTERIDEGLRGVTVNVPTHAEAVRVLALSRAVAALLDRVRPLEANEPPMTSTLDVARRLELVRRRLPELPGPIAERALAFETRLTSLSSSLAAVGVPMTELWLDTRRRSGLTFALREFAISFALAPVAWWGRLNHWLPLRFATLVGRWSVQHPDEPAMRTIVAGVAAVGLWYIAVFVVVQQLFGLAEAAAYMLLLPFAASVDFWISDRWQRVKARARSYLFFRRNADRHRVLLAEAAWLRAEADRLQAMLAASEA